MQTNSTKAPEFVEHIPNVALDYANILSDNSLASGGLVRVSAFMRTKASANAARVKKAREKAADTGIRQLNVVVPLAAHAAMKAIAKDLQAGGLLSDVLKAALAHENFQPTPVRVPSKASSSVPPLRARERRQHAELATTRLANLKGWRLLLARLVGRLTPAGWLREFRARRPPRTRP